MILRDRLQILDSLMQSAKEVLSQYKSIAESASTALTKSEIWMQTKDADPKDIVDIFRRIHDMQIQTLQTLNSIIERFPVEHTIQELQLLEVFRNLTERQKKTLMSQLEQLIVQKRG